VFYSLTPRRYNPCRVVADSSNRLQPTLSLALLLQFLTPSLSASLITPSIHLRFGLPTRLLPSGLSKVIFLHGRLSSIRTICPAHLSLDILIAVTKSISSYRRYRSSLYLHLHVAPSQRGPQILLNIFLSKTPRRASSALLSPFHISKAHTLSFRDKHFLQG
jgi:hypothetical protein